MIPKLSAAVLLSLLAGIAFAQPPKPEPTKDEVEVAVLKYIDRGMPLPDRIWSGADLALAAKMLRDPGGLPLPKKGDPLTGTIFARLVNPENFDILKNANLPIGLATLELLSNCCRSRDSLDENISLGRNASPLDLLAMKSASAGYVFLSESLRRNAQARGGINGVREIRRTLGFFAVVRFIASRSPILTQNRRPWSPGAATVLGRSQAVVRRSRTFAPDGCLPS